MTRMKVLLSCAAVVGTISMPAVAQDAGPIKIGVLTDVSGQFSHEAGDGSIAAVKMAVEDFGGKVLDRPLEVLVADHQNKPEVAVSTAREWYESQGVAMINNLINSGIALAVTEVAKDEDKIAIVNGSGSSRLTNDSCTPNSIHYSYDTYALANGTANELIRQGLKNWFFLTADYAFGQALEADATQIVKANGGTVSGAVRYPIETSDHSAFMLQAQASPAQVVAMAGSGTTFVNAVKSASEFGLASSGKTVAGLLVWDTDVHSLGLETAQGMILTNAFYWDRNDETRAFAKKFEARVGRPPHMGDAGDYSSTTHYLNAVKAVGSTDTKQVMAKMREMPINDFFATNGKIREDGRMVHDMYVYQVKTPAESKSEWDLLKLVTTIPGDKAFRPLSDSKCPLVKK
ncbi:putative ABC branched-chain amino transporter, periplasmic binding protein [Agrobacterium fabacearum CFBP 5771]|jgi:branched-chain amino acid transport system substrate-binding protein|uniref:ABC transporter substrate-binding protein n=3 Tax=Agrobacterium TaxID=357 RepID=A0A4D7Z2H3_AGRTU|nr:ABC transporter substrate-binding protein [Agrobacterium tumefaciens]MCP2138359.1 branched-chain amino acid transport system substrate-binding protein [Rhizobium sp. SLBN-94]QCL98132.1 ABC transporter substrate-binding protein [Agrobacterium tumefaciens]CVI24936.1 putative ABC branched-chain amino transporter, periplasmic binding protein [Agrobacterium fabacearum CFBP 5771]